MPYVVKSMIENIILLCFCTVDDKVINKNMDDSETETPRVRRCLDGGMEGGLVYPISCVYSGSLLLLLAASHSHSLFP